MIMNTQNNIYNILLIESTDGEQSGGNVDETEEAKTANKLVGREIADIEGKPKGHSRLNLYSKLQRCNSLTETPKIKRLDTSMEANSSYIDPYKQKESPEPTR